MGSKSSAEAKKGMTTSAFITKFSIVLVLVLMVIVLSIIRPSFRTSTNIFNVLTQSSIFGILAVGLIFVIISKGIDLSVGSVLAFAGVVMGSVSQVVDATGKLMPFGPVPFVVTILVALGVGTLCGIVNGLLMAKTRIPAFIATLGMQTAARGLALIYTNGKPVSNLDPNFAWVGGKIFGVIPVPVIIYLIVIIIGWILLNNTRFGKNVYAIGANSTAAVISGINVDRTTVGLYAISGFLAGLAAIVFSGRTLSAHPGAADGYELTAIAATTIGGTSHSGGIGTMWGAVVGALILGVLRNGLTLLGVHAYWQQVVEGAIIVVAVIIDMRKNARKA